MRHIIKIIKPTIFTIGLLSTSALIGLSAVNASGGGGGGGGGGSLGGSGGGSSSSQSKPRYDASEEYQKGVTAFQAKEYKKAITAFKRSLSVSSKNANAHYLVGVSYVNLDNHKKARKSFEKAIRYNANMIEAHRDLALTYHALNQNDKAQSVLSDLVSLQERCAGTCADDALLSNAVSKVKSKIAGDQASLQTAPELAFVQNINAKAGDTIYVNAVALINEKKYDAAIASLETATRNLGPHPDILTYLGFANRKLRNFDIAESYYKQALAVAPNHLGANEYFGELMVERGNIAGAKKQLAKLESLCDFGCYEAEELRRWIDAASSV